MVYEIQARTVRGLIRVESQALKAMSRKFSILSTSANADINRTEPTCTGWNRACHSDTVNQDAGSSRAFVVYVLMYNAISIQGPVKERHGHLHRPKRLVQLIANRGRCAWTLLSKAGSINTLSESNICEIG